MCKSVQSNLRVHYSSQGPYASSVVNPALADIYKTNLKQIFLVGDSTNNSYDYNCLPGSSSCPAHGSGITGCHGDGTGPRNCSSNPEDPNCFCAIYPTINNIELRDREGKKIIPEGNSYHLSASDFYTITFGVTVDAEQTPVSQLLVDFGDGTEKLERTQIDPSTRYNIVHYYNPQGTGQDYNIRIKVKDNWGFYKCTGMPNTQHCMVDCCVNSFQSNLQACIGCL
jgi:hypothetical protein